MATSLDHYHLFSPRPPKAAFRLNERVLDILDHLHGWGRLNSCHLWWLDGGSRDMVRRKLQYLSALRYVRRIDGQRQRFSDNHNPLVYGLTNKGARLLEERRGIEQRRDWDEFNRDLTNSSITHLMLRHDLMVRLVADARKRPEITLLRKGDMQKTLASDKQPSPRVRGSWETLYTDENGEEHKARVKYDDIFAFVYSSDPSRPASGFFAEADTGTKEIAGEGRQRVFRQLLGYVATHEQKLHTDFFGWENFRVLFLTTSQARVGHLIEANQAFNQGLGSRMFLFADTASLHAAPDVYELEWTNGQGQRVKLLD